jgi:hypothetical protein
VLYTAILASKSVTVQTLQRVCGDNRYYIRRLVQRHGNGSGEFGAFTESGGSF